MKLQYPNENTNNNKNKFSSLHKEINKKEQEFLSKFQIYGDSFSDQELLDIFAKNDYDERKIINDIKALLSIGNNKNSDEDNDNDNADDYHLPSFGPNKNGPKYKINKNEKIYVKKYKDIPSDYAAPPEDDENEIMEYKRGLFEKLKTVNNTYKSNKNNNNEISIKAFLSNEKKDNNNNKRNEIKMIEFDKNNKNNYNTKNNQSFQKKRISQNITINKELKKKYIQSFFNNMKRYSKNLPNRNRRANYEKSPDFGKRKNILELSPDKEQLYEKQVYTYKKGIKNHYLKKNNNYYLKVESKVNDVYLSACYDNPQREQFLKMINEKRKENPDKIIEFLIPQFSPINTIPYYSNISPQYSQFNPYMNMYMMPSLQNSLIGVSMNSQIQNSNINNSQNINNNMASNIMTHEIQNSLTNLESLPLSSNNNQANYLNNNNSILNSLMMNNNNNNAGLHKNRSSGNFSSSGVINTTSSFK